MKRQNLRTVSLIVVTFTYLLIGAAIFGYLESEHEVRQREYLELIELIVKRKYNISDDDFTVLTTTVIKSVPHKAGIQWKFPGAFYFATTVVTTIGYGHSTPATMAGRSFCMIYALIGIPLGLVMFQSIGERLNTFVGSALKYAKRCFKAQNPEVTQTNLVMVVSVLSTILMTSMAAVFAKYERWDYFDALYYCFITLTTIGFGDYVALQKESALQSKPEYVALSLIFILFGLSVVSSAVNLLVLKFLTLNTEDERRDEQLRYTANLNPIQLEGDVITSAGGAIICGAGARKLTQADARLSSAAGNRLAGSPSHLQLRHQVSAGSAADPAELAIVPLTAAGHRLNSASYLPPAGHQYGRPSRSFSHDELCAFHVRPMELAAAQDLDDDDDDDDDEEGSPEAEEDDDEEEKVVNYNDAYRRQCLYGDETCNGHHHDHYDYLQQTYCARTTQNYHDRPCCYSHRLQPVDGAAENLSHYADQKLASPPSDQHHHHHHQSPGTEKFHHHHHHHHHHHRQPDTELPVARQHPASSSSTSILTPAHTFGSPSKHQQPPAIQPVASAAAAQQHLGQQQGGCLFSHTNRHLRRRPPDDFSRRHHHHHHQHRHNSTHHQQRHPSRQGSRKQLHKQPAQIPSVDAQLGQWTPADNFSGASCSCSWLSVASGGGGHSLQEQQQRPGVCSHCLTFETHRLVGRRHHHQPTGWVTAAAAAEHPPPPPPPEIPRPSAANRSDRSMRRRTTDMLELATSRNHLRSMGADNDNSPANQGPVASQSLASSARMLTSARPQSYARASSSSSLVAAVAPKGASGQPEELARSQKLVSSGDDGEPIAKLVCKCCCQHLECIEHALNAKVEAAGSGDVQVAGETTKDKTLADTTDEPVVERSLIVETQIEDDATKPLSSSDSQQRRNKTEIFSLGSTSATNIKSLSDNDQHKQPPQSDRSEDDHSY